MRSRLPSPKPAWVRVWGPLAASGAGALAAVVGAGVALVRVIRDPGGEWLLLLMGAVVLLAIFVREVLQIWLSLTAARDQRRLVESSEIQAACQVLREQLAVRFDAERPEDFRVCVYRAAKRRDGHGSELERVTRYAVGLGGDPGEAGKRVSDKSGVIGLAFRTGDAQVAYRQSDDIEGFRQEMIAEWGFDAAEARTLNESRWSFIAVPIKTGAGQVDAVVYADASVRECFSQTVLEELVLPMCEATTIVIEKRYGHGD